MQNPKTFKVVHREGFTWEKRRNRGQDVEDESTIKSIIKCNISHISINLCSFDEVKANFKKPDDVNENFDGKQSWADNLHVVVADSLWLPKEIVIVSRAILIHFVKNQQKWSKSERYYSRNCYNLTPYLVESTIGLNHIPFQLWHALGSYFIVIFVDVVYHHFSEFVFGHFS